MIWSDLIGRGEGDLWRRVHSCFTPRCCGLDENFECAPEERPRESLGAYNAGTGTSRLSAHSACDYTGSLRWYSALRSPNMRAGAFREI